MPEQQSTHTSPSAPAANSGTQPPAQGQDLEKLAQQVAERVWQLWQQEVRQTRERRRPKGGK
ncbi:MAG: hypothetical protein HXY40_09180 [Chloroflexi bacterium]|nr:hypothetical protein [Chloroflexota bacterium]